MGVDPAGDDRSWTCGPKKVKSDEGNEGEDVRDASDVGVALEFQAHVWPLLVKHDVTAAFLRAQPRVPAALRVRPGT